MMHGGSIVNLSWDLTSAKADLAKAQAGKNWPLRFVCYTSKGKNYKIKFENCDNLEELFKISNYFFERRGEKDAKILKIIDEFDKVYWDCEKEAKKAEIEEAKKKEIEESKKKEKTKRATLLKGERLLSVEVANVPKNSTAVILEHFKKKIAEGVYTDIIDIWSGGKCVWSNKELRKKLKEEGKLDSTIPFKEGQDFASQDELKNYLQKINQGKK